MELIVPELAEQNGVTEQLKAENQMEWVRQMNSGQKTVRTFLIYSKVAVELFIDFMI